MPSLYFDYASSCPCDPKVIEAMRPFFFEFGANASSHHGAGRRTRRAVDDARQTLADFLGAGADEIFFTSGATESNNHAIFSTARGLKNKGRHIVASAIEHHSVREPLRVLSEEGFEVDFVKPASDGLVGIEAIKAALRPDTILVCLLHANNEIGTIQPVEETGLLCQDRQIRFLVDATQTVGHIPVSLRDIHADMLSLSAHKFYGPKGAGALYVRKGLDLPPFIFGGSQERGLRAGTHNTPGIVGLAEAVKICCSRMPKDAARETALREGIIDFVLREIPGVRLNGHRQKRLPNNAHFSFENINGEELVSALDLGKAAVSMGSACRGDGLKPSHVLKAIGLSDQLCWGALRVSVGRWTRQEDVDDFLNLLKLTAGRLCKSASSNS